MRTYVREGHPARRCSLAGLREVCARSKAGALPDAEARRRAIHRQRYRRSYVDAEGAWNLRVRDNPEVGAGVTAALELIRDRLFGRARAQARPEPSEAYGADALAELATHRPPRRPLPGQDHRAGRPGRPAAGPGRRGRGL